MKKEKELKIVILVLISILVLILSVGLGSVYIPASDIVSVLLNKLFNMPLTQSIEGSYISILWDIRLPRAFTAFFVGAALSVSGAVIQSILQNPLASSYTLGVSAGASLGAAIVITSGITSSLLGFFLLPAAGFLAGLFTVFFVIAVSGRLDHNMSNHTIILFGMVFSLFVNAILTLISALNSEHMQRLILWQMGSFSGRRWIHVAVLSVCAVLGTLIICFFVRELDIMTFGEEEAMSIGVETKKVKVFLLALATFLTGAAVCFSGIIGFVDLTIPHIVRRLFGSKHKYVIPMSFVLGGAFMAFADMLSRTVLAPQEIPVGAITALVGAPFFAYIYFRGKR
ncbi:iron complex transport system permease protein [Butyrivibrio proteoclasticus]|uniref:Iron complex transport system permease protein n=1 Tax=Butyrivibrio proteoclasticus TaxID=43305 RepID=A0A1I5QDG4_9FIRM|nr:iron ABC transporter permease [Butyrivibrio proteoclasticus]SFP44147.1 iron complex transport system permease protein [Butyrivibrio proteoclasticus]